MQGQLEEVSDGAAYDEEEGGAGDESEEEEESDEVHTYMQLHDDHCRLSIPGSHFYFFASSIGCCLHFIIHVRAQETAASVASICFFFPFPS